MILILLVLLLNIHTFLWNIAHDVRRGGNFREVKKVLTETNKYEKYKKRQVEDLTEKNHKALQRERKKTTSGNKMLKKYALKVQSTFSPINYIRPQHSKSSSQSRSSSSSDDDGGGNNSRCSSCCESNYDQSELNRNLFIENYLIGRGNNKMRSASLTIADDALKEIPLRRNNRRKSFMEKRDDRIKINRNHLFNHHNDSNISSNNNINKKSDRAIIRQYGDDYYFSNIRNNNNNSNNTFYYDMDDEKSLGCDIIETSAPTLRKLNNILRECVDFELSIVLLFSRSQLLTCY